MMEPESHQQSQDPDYRSSHLGKGEDYDRDLAAEPFDRYMTAREAEIYLPLIDRLFPGGVPRYLDFACGTGRITQQVESRARASYGLDVSESMVEEARKKCQRTEFFLRDATVEPLDIEPVNLVTSFRLFGNAQHELRVGALRAMHRMLVPGGYLIFNNHRNAWSVHNLMLRLKHEPLAIDLSWAKMRQLLTDNGFRLVRTFGVGFWVMRWKHFHDPNLLEGWRARTFEPISRLRPLGPFSPDAVFLAQRK